jgi:hypothetical protein
MADLLSFEESPPLGAPLRFFLTAPCFAILAGVLLLSSGPDGLASRWTPTALALTHLIAAGFMLQVMLGALLQIMPVVAGANMARPLRVASVVHAAVTLGALLLAAAFMSFSPLLFKLAAVFLGAGIVFFVGSAARALRGMALSGPSIPTIQGVAHALAGLCVTLILGLLMSVSLGWSYELPLLPLMQLADIHLAWGFIAWATVLLAAVAYVVVPMFQLTPAYPDWFSRRFSFAVLAALVLWTVAEFLPWGGVQTLLGTLPVVLAALFFGITLKLQRRSKRARFDATQHLWRMAMVSALAACAVWLLAPILPDVEQEWPLLCGVLVLFGAFMSVMVGMLYKILPFLIWLHLQNRGQGRIAAPNMKKIIAERQMDRQMLAHFASCALLLLAVFWPQGFVYPAGGALIVANGWLLHNLLSALSVHRSHLLKIESAISAAAQR